MQCKRSLTCQCCWLWKWRKGPQLPALGSWKEKARRLPWLPPDRAQSCWHVDFHPVRQTCVRVLTLQNCKMVNLVILRHPICVNLLQQPYETYSECIDSELVQSYPKEWALPQWKISRLFFGPQISTSHFHYNSSWTEIIPPPVTPVSWTGPVPPCPCTILRVTLPRRTWKSHVLVTEFTQEDCYYNQNMYCILLKYHYLVLLFQSTSHILS